TAACSMSSAASTASAKKCASSSCIASKSIRCCNSRPLLPLQQNNSGNSQPATECMIKSSTPTESSADLFPKKCLRCSTPDNSGASSTSIGSIGFTFRSHSARCSFCSGYLCEQQCPAASMNRRGLPPP